MVSGLEGGGEDCEENENKKDGALWPRRLWICIYRLLYQNNIP